MFHLNVRVPWHDNRWDGTVCRQPSANSFCVDLERIREEKRDTAEDAVAGRHFSDLAVENLPPCRNEAAGFMSDREWWLVREHPYSDIPAAADTHGQLRPTRIRIPAYSALAVPFWWMLRQNQDAIDESVPEPLPPDEDSPFNSPWVFGRSRQERLSELFFDRLTPGHSLVTFYTKSGHPLGDGIARLVVGVGRLDKVGPMLRYDTAAASSYPLWDRVVSHSIRSAGSAGFLFPYHDYLEPKGDPDEDARRARLAREIAVVPDDADIMSYSYAGALASPDVTLSTLIRCLDTVRLIKTHGIASGPWAQREEWLNEQIGHTWQDRGPFPGAGAALEALGMRLGTALILDLVSDGAITTRDDPWPVLDGLLRGRVAPPRDAYLPDLAAARGTWAGLSDERRSLLMLLSRFALTGRQAQRWFDPRERAKATRSSVTDAAILANPYRIVETDLGDATDHPVSHGEIDRGLLPDQVIAAGHPVPEPSRVEAQLDPRRVRAGMVTALRAAADDGDTLLSRDETLDRLSRLDLAQPCVVPTDWVTGHPTELGEAIALVGTPVDDEGNSLPCMQLTEFEAHESYLRKVLLARARKVVPSLGENWRLLLRTSIREAGASVDEQNDRHRIALDEQADALECITTRRLSVLVGRAGTGKTTVLGALLRASSLASSGVLFLAPTGKARVRITQQAGVDARTVAQFLYGLGRYDGERQRPLLAGKDVYKQAKTVVIDESSMLTLDTLVAVLKALDLAHVQRVILVGDPNQLPPIGAGRPFADLVATLDAAESSGDPSGNALARLVTELRSRAGVPSDALRLASWFTREPQPPDADSVLSDLESGGRLNDLAVRTWTTPDELRSLLDELLSSELGLRAPTDLEGFNRALGLTKEGWVPWDDHDGAERFQLLSPVRQHPYGVHELNRWVQQRYRTPQLQKARGRGGVSLGEEEIVWGDKIILVRNGNRKGFDFSHREQVTTYLANGEVGFAAKPKNGRYLNIALAQRPHQRFAFGPGQFGTTGAPLELAYVLTIHKSQGSEFNRVFVILPKHSPLLSRELLYTAITRARDRLILLIEGTDATALYDLTRPERSETARRNTNLFTAAVRAAATDAPFAKHLIHRTTRGELVRSKSELVIANHLHNIGLDYRYEDMVEGEQIPGRRRPDFTFVDAAGDRVLWEHLGMLGRPDYEASWARKRDWYLANGWVEGQNLFTTTEDDGGLDSMAIAEIAEKVRAVVE